MPGKNDLLGQRAAAYLRKSRLEEGMETEEVLSRHKQGLIECAAYHGLSIEEYYPEVVSGESLYARPQMLRLLEDVEAGKFDAVLCMDLDRLSRGRMKDQGIILDAFKDSGTLIVTPDKVYDLADEIDDELAEFKTFMARREYKIITKRMQRGVKRSIQEGFYVSEPPYGYQRKLVDRRPTLEIYEPEARFVRMMYARYLEGAGCTTIAREVNAMGARPHRADAFSRSSVAFILRNHTYTGKIVWDRKKHIKKNTKGNEKHIAIYNPQEQWTVVDGIHSPIVSEEDFNAVQEIMAGRYHAGYNDGTVRNPLSGLIFCANCGRHMQRQSFRRSRSDYLLCVKAGCCASAQFDLVEERVVLHLQDVLKRLEMEPETKTPDLAPLEEALALLTKELSTAQRQKDRLHELLEIGEYDLPTYRERMDVVKKKLADLEARIEEARDRRDKVKGYDPSVQAQKIRNVLEAYQSSDAAGRNALLRTVISKIIYKKEKKTKPNDFSLSFVMSD